MEVVAGKETTNEYPVANVAVAPLGFVKTKRRGVAAVAVHVIVFDAGKVIGVTVEAADAGGAVGSGN